MVLSLFTIKINIFKPENVKGIKAERALITNIPL